MRAPLPHSPNPSACDGMRNEEADREYNNAQYACDKRRLAGQQETQCGDRHATDQYGSSAHSIRQSACHRR